MPPRPKSTSPARRSDVTVVAGNTSRSHESCGGISATSCVLTVNGNTSTPSSSASLHLVQQNHQPAQKHNCYREIAMQVHRESNQKSQGNVINLIEFQRDQIGGANPHFYNLTHQQQLAAPPQFQAACSVQGQVNTQGLAAGSVTMCSLGKPMIVEQPANSQLLGPQVGLQQPQQLQQMYYSSGSQVALHGIDKLTQQFLVMSTQTPSYAESRRLDDFTTVNKQEKDSSIKSQASPDQLASCQQLPQSWPHIPFCLAPSIPMTYISNQSETQYIGYIPPNSVNSEMTLMAPYPSNTMISKGPGSLTTNAELNSSSQKLYSHHTTPYDPSTYNSAINQLATPSITASQFTAITNSPNTTNSNQTFIRYVNPHLSEVAESQFAIAVNPQLSSAGAIKSNGLDNKIYCTVPNHLFNLQPNPSYTDPSNMSYIPTSIPISYGYPLPSLVRESDAASQSGMTLMAPEAPNVGLYPPSLVATDVRSNAGSSLEQENCGMNSEMGLLTKAGMDCGYLAMIPAPMSTLNCSVPQSFNPLMNSANMEMVWHGDFNCLFGKFAPHVWNLSPTIEEIQDPAFTLFNDSAKVRFLCENCCNAWTSMKGRVVFWFSLDHTRQQGQVYFKLFGQKCQKCMPEEFEHAMWYPEEVNKVLTNLHLRVGTAYYGWAQITGNGNRRSGKPRTQHNSSLCQACATGICREGGATLGPPALVTPVVCEYPMTQGLGRANMLAQLQVVV